MAPADANTPFEKLYLSTQPAPPRRWNSQIEIPRRLALVQEQVQTVTRQADSTALRWLRAGARQIWTWIVLVFLFSITYGFINRYIVTSVIVQGRSMAPTLQDGERYLLDRWTYHYRHPERGDVVVLRDPGHEDLAIKRIVGMPGDTIHLKDGILVVNGKRFIEPYLTRGTRTYTPDMKDRLVMLGEDQYFVLGDNRGLSEDSRFYGPIQRQRIVGCVSR